MNKQELLRALEALSGRGTMGVWVERQEAISLVNQLSEPATFDENKILDALGESMRLACGKADYNDYYRKSIAPKVLEAIRPYLRSEPTEAMCDSARSFLLSMEIGIKSYEGMRENFERLGEEVPAWMRDREGHLTKWDKADCIWRLMASAASPEQKG